MNYVLTAFVSGLVGVTLGILLEQWDIRRPHRIEASAKYLLCLAIKQIKEDQK